MSASQRRFEEPSDEQLAAYLDGTMNPAERETVAARIAADPNLRALVVNVAEFLHSESAGVAPPLLAPQAQSHAARERVFGRWWQVGALAASLVLALVARPGWMPSFDTDWSSALSSGTDLPALVAQVQRSEANIFGFGATLAPDARSFRVGAKTVDLAIALRAPGSGAGSAEIAQEILELVDEPRRPALATMLSRSADGRGALSLAGVEEELRSVAPDRFHFELGRWVEASRIAAATGNRSFFQDKAFQHALRQARSRGSRDEARSELDRAASILASQPLDLRHLQRCFEQIGLLY